MRYTVEDLQHDREVAREVAPREQATHRGEPASERVRITANNWPACLSSRMEKLQSPHISFEEGPASHTTTARSCILTLIAVMYGILNRTEGRRAARHL